MCAKLDILYDKENIEGSGEIYGVEERLKCSYVYIGYGHPNTSILKCGMLYHVTG